MKNLTYQLLHFCSGWLFIGTQNKMQLVKLFHIFLAFITVTFAFANSAQYLASVSGKTVKIWDAKTNECVATFKHNRNIDSVAFSQFDKNTVASECGSIVKIWDIETKNCIATFENDGFVSSVVFSPFYENIVAAADSEDACYGDNFRLKILDIKTKKCIAVLEHGGEVSSVTFSPFYENIVASVSYVSGDQVSGYDNSESKVNIWDIKTKKCIAILDNDTSFSNGKSNVHSVTFSPFSKNMVASASSKGFKLWDIKTKNCIAVFKSGSYVNLAIFSPFYKNIVASVSGKEVHIWDIETKKCIATFKHDAGVESVTFSSFDKNMVASVSGKEVHIWDIKTNKCIATFKHDAGVESVTFSPFDKNMAAVASGKEVHIWDIEMKKCIAKLGHENLSEYDCVKSVTFSPGAFPYHEELASMPDFYTPLGKLKDVDSDYSKKLEEIAKRKKKTFKDCLVYAKITNNKKLFRGLMNASRMVRDLAEIDQLSYEVAAQIVGFAGWQNFIYKKIYTPAKKETLTF